MNMSVEYPFDKNKLIDICRGNDVIKASLFGSMARGESTADSDVDLLVEFNKRKSLLAMVALERKISSAIGRKVDLLTEGALSPYLRDRILHEAKVIYEA
jgi:predicted nucleotidyltransferase